jgi:hemerythrin
MFITSPSAKTHFDEHHAQCFEMFNDQSMTLLRAHLGKTKLNIALDDVTPRTANTIR